MTKQIIDIGTVANDKSGTPLREAFDMINDNFTENYDAIARNESDIAQNTNNIVLIGRANIQNSTNISKTSTSYTDCGVELNYTPKLAGSQLEVSLEGLAGLDSLQTGIELEVNYSLDNGASYSTEKIYEYLLHETGTNVDRTGFKNSILLTTPSTPLNCIFKINIRVKVSETSGTNGYILGAIKKTILQVTEFNI